MPVKVDLGQAIQGAVLVVLGVLFLAVWAIASLFSFIMPWGSPQSLLFIGVVLVLGGVAFALTGFSYWRRRR